MSHDLNNKIIDNSPAPRSLAVIILIDDCDDDAFFLQNAFGKERLEFQMEYLSSGQDAVNYLSRCGPDHAFPDVILLDLKMPGMDGFGVLAWLQTQPHLCHPPVVVLSSSDEERDKARASELGARDFLSKPHCQQGYFDLATALHQRWLSFPPSRPAERVSQHARVQPESSPLS